MCCWRWRENLNTSYVRVNAVKTAVPKSWLLHLSSRLHETACHCSCSTQSRNIPAWLSLPVYWRLQRVPKCNWTDAPTSLGALRQHQRFALAYCMFPSTSMHLLEWFNTPSIQRTPSNLIEKVRNKSIMLKSSQNSRSNHTGQEVTELSLPGNPDVFPWCYAIQSRSTDDINFLDVELQQCGRIPAGLNTCSPHKVLSQQHLWQ